MISFKDFLTESITTPYPYHWTAQPRRLTDASKWDNWTGAFKTSTGIEYSVVVYMYYSQKRLTSEIVFYSKSIPPGGRYHDVSVGITGTGDAFRVFSTVVAMIIEMVNIAHPTVIKFTAKEKSRVILYSRAARMLAAKFGGGRVDQDTNDDGEEAFLIKMNY